MRDNDGFYVLDTLDILSPFTKIPDRSGYDIGEHRLIIPNEKTKGQHKKWLSELEREELKSMVYDIDAGCGSWVRKAWNIAGRFDLPTPKNSGFKDDSHKRVSKIIRVIYQFRIYTEQKKNAVPRYIYKSPIGSYGAIDDAEEFYHVINLIMKMLYKYGQDGYPTDMGSIKAITVYCDGTYDTFLGNPIKYLETLGIRVNTYHKKWIIK